jgi:hypothetical protein
LRGTPPACATVYTTPHRPKELLVNLDRYVPLLVLAAVALAGVVAELIR